MIPKAMLTMAKVKSTISRLEILIFRGTLYLKCTVHVLPKTIYIPKMLILRPSEWTILHISFVYIRPIVCQSR